MDQSSEPICIAFSSRAATSMRYYERKDFFYLPALHFDEYYTYLSDYKVENYAYRITHLEAYENIPE